MLLAQKTTGEGEDETRKNASDKNNISYPCSSSSVSVHSGMRDFGPFAAQKLLNYYDFQSDIY